MVTVLYQAYGHQDILNECLFSIMSFLRQVAEDEQGPSAGSRPACKILIYTDQPEFFRPWLSSSPIPVNYEQLTARQIQEYRGAIDFVHRVKVKVIEHFFAHHQGHLFYVDSDTVFTSPPWALFQAVAEGQFVMHINEGRISDKINPIFKKMYRFLRRNAFVLGPMGPQNSGNKTFIPVDTAMWNAGVLGIPEGQKDLVQEVLSLTDQMYSIYAKHVMEQFAFSYILFRRGEILSADKQIHHYWDFKEFRVEIAEFLDRHREQPLAQVLQADAPKPIRPPKKATWSLFSKWRAYW